MVDLSEARTVALAYTGDDSAPDLLNIEGYSTVGVIGEGGMGTVYLAEDITLHRQVAIKTVRRQAIENPAARERFMREAQTMATIEDPNVVRLYAYGTTADAAYMVMEYVKGESLASMLRRYGRLPVDDVCRIAIQICYGLRTAAGKGIVHRDIKPANVLIDERRTVRVADFGLAKPAVSQSEMTALTIEGLVVGTPHYMSPEQADGRPITAASDVYSLGIMLYELLTGAKPFDGSTPVVVIAKHLHEPLPNPKKRVWRVPLALVKLLRAMTAKNPERRPSYDALIAQLETILARSTVTVASVSRRQALLVLLLIVSAFSAGYVLGDLVDKNGIAPVAMFGLGCIGVGIVFAAMWPRRPSRL